MLIYLICVGAVLQGDGSWLYDHWRSGYDLHSAVVIEIIGLIFSIIFSVSNPVYSVYIASVDVCVCVRVLCVCL